MASQFALVAKFIQLMNGEKFTKRDIAEMDGMAALKFYPELLDIIDLFLGKGELSEWINNPGKSGAF